MLQNVATGSVLMLQNVATGSVLILQNVRHIYTTPKQCAPLDKYSHYLL
jgi:hypothetical protein